MKKTKNKKFTLSNKTALTFQQNDDFSDIPIIGTKPSLRERAKLDLTKKLKPPTPALTVGGEIFGTLGNFSMVIGKAKSRKTFLMTLIMTACVGFKHKKKMFGGMHLIQGVLPPGKRRVVFVDTEQGAYHVGLVGNRVKDLSDSAAHDIFDAYATRKFSTDERLQIIEEIIEDFPDLGMLIIDGVRDIITSINDEEQATFIANKLLKWTEVNQIHIITVLHQNKNDTNARGHVGTELMNKAETTVSVDHKKAEDITVVKVDYSRNKEFDPFAFRIDEKGHPSVVDGWAPESKKPKGKVSPVDVDKLIHKRILKYLESKLGEKPKHSDVLSMIKLAVSAEFQDIGDTRARDYFTYYMGENVIKKNGKDHSPKAYYTIHPGGQNG